MKYPTLIAILALLVMSTVASPPLLSADEETVYGWQLMTEEERAEHRAKLRSLHTKEERQAYRLEHHKRMQERAKERGVKLPDEPMPRGRGQGPGGANGMGPGPRDGQGKGRQ